MVTGLLGNESSDSNRFTLVTPKSENDVRLQATLGNQNPTGLPVGVVRSKPDSVKRFVDAIEEAERDRTPKQTLPGRQLTNPQEILALMAKMKKQHD